MLFKLCAQIWTDLVFAHNFDVLPAVIDVFLVLKLSALTMPDELNLKCLNWIKTRVLSESAEQYMVTSLRFSFFFSQMRVSQCPAIYLSKSAGLTASCRIDFVICQFRSAPNSIDSRCLSVNETTNLEPVNEISRSYSSGYWFLLSFSLQSLSATKTTGWCAWLCSSELEPHIASADNFSCLCSYIISANCLSSERFDANGGLHVSVLLIFLLLHCLY